MRGFLSFLEGAHGATMLDTLPALVFLSAKSAGHGWWGPRGSETFMQLMTPPDP